MYPGGIYGLRTTKGRMSTIVWQRRLKGVAEDAHHEAVVALRQRNTEKLEEELLKVSDPTSPDYLKHWNRERLGKFVSPEEGAVKTVIEHLERQGRRHAGPS